MADPQVTKLPSVSCLVGLLLDGLIGFWKGGNSIE